MESNDNNNGRPDQVLGSPSAVENAPSGAPRYSTVSPVLVAEALQALALDIEAVSPGALTRMTAGDFVATATASFRLMGETPRRLRAPQAFAQPRVDLSTYAEVVKTLSSTGLVAMPRQAKDRGPKKPSSPRAKRGDNAAEALRKRVLNACVNSFKRTKDPERRDVYNTYVKSLKHLREYVRNMSIAQLKSMPKDKSALLGCGIIPAEATADWYQEAVLSETAKLQVSRQAGAVVGKVPPPAPVVAEPVVISPVVTASGKVKKVPPPPVAKTTKAGEKQKKLPPPGQGAIAKADKTGPASSKPRVGKEKNGSQKVVVKDCAKVLTTPFKDDILMDAKHLTTIIGLKVDPEGRSTLPCSVVGYHLREAAVNNMIQLGLAQAFQKEDNPSLRAISPAEVRVLYSCKAGSGSVQLSSRPTTIKEGAPRINFAASLLINRPTVGTEPILLRALISRSLATLSSAVAEQARRGWVVVTCRPNDKADEVQSRLEPEAGMAIRFEPC